MCKDAYDYGFTNGKELSIGEAQRALTKAVQDNMHNGWQPLGSPQFLGVFLEEDKYWHIIQQAMVKYVE